MTDFNKILEKAKAIEKKMKESQENLKKIEVNGVSGGDAVTVLLNGEDLSEKQRNTDEANRQDFLEVCEHGWQHAVMSGKMLEFGDVPI